jgi:peptidoglycan-associated lipoprotein
MLKKLLILSAILSLFACQAKTKKDDLEKEKTESKEQLEQYQTIDNEQQAEALNKQAQEQIEEIEVQDRILFDYDSFAISNEAKTILDNQVAWLKSDLSIKVTIEGHCDERGTREYNIALGERRANSVKKYLTTNGIEESRLKTISYGKERPAFIGSSEDAFSKNRRAVTVVN